MGQLKLAWFARLPLLIAVMGATGCPGNNSTPFPPGLEPLEDDTAPPPRGTADDPYPETLSMVSGHGASWNWTHARGFIHAPVAAVWPSFHAPEVAHDPTIADWSADDLADPDVPVSFVIHYTVHDVLTIQFDVTWRFGFTGGSEQAPTGLAARFQKTWGSTFIRTMEGSLVVTPVDDQTSEIELIEHLDATDTSTSDIEEYLGDYYRQLLAAVHGGG